MDIENDDKKLSESFNELLYKFIIEAKKSKEESNSLPILDDSTNDDNECN